MAMRTGLVFLLAFAAANLLSAFADVDEDACGGMFVKVNKKSGRVFFLRSRRKKDVSTKAFEIALERIKQLGEDGRPVGKPIESLANQDFNISRLDRSAKLGKVNAAKLDIRAFLKDPQAYLHIELYIMCEGGTVTFGDDEIVLKNGSMKFFVKLENYTFCDGMNNDTSRGCRKNKKGKDLEVSLVVTGRKRRAPKRQDEIKDKDGRPKNITRRMPCKKQGKCGKHFILGDGSKDDDEMTAASKCKLDGKFANMSGDYPKFMVQGGKNWLILKVPKFNRTVELDPGVTLGEEDEEDDDDDKDKDKDQAASIQLNLLLFFVMLTSLFAFM